MIRYDPEKIILKDINYKKEIQNTVQKLERILDLNSYLAYINARDILEKLKLLVQKNNEDYKRCYLQYFKRYDTFKKRVAWDFHKPYSDFESKVLPLMDRSKILLKTDLYSENIKCRKYIEKLENELESYIQKTGLIDTSLRIEINSRISRLKENMESKTLFSYMNSKKILAELKKLKEINNRKYEEIYLKILKKIKTLKNDFEQNYKYFSIKDTGIIKEQFSEIDSIMKTQSYEEFENARDILDVIEIKLSEVISDKKRVITKSIHRDLNALRKKAWLEDWQIISQGAEKLIEDAERTGSVDDLNLDKFKTDHKEFEKKQDIFNFIKKVKTSNKPNKDRIIEKAESMLRNEAFKKDLESLKGIKNFKRSAKKSKTVSFKKKKIFKYAFLVIFIITVIIILGVNHVKSVRHFEKKGNQYAIFAESIVYSYKKKGIDIDKDKIRARMGASKKDLKILSVDENEIVISYKGQTYKKAVRQAD